jgi:hypothetical protein
MRVLADRSTQKIKSKTDKNKLNSEIIRFIAVIGMKITNIGPSGLGGNGFYVVLNLAALDKGFDSILDVPGAYSILIQEFIGLSRPRKIFHSKMQYITMSF